MTQKNFDVIVVGAGIGGLVASNYLAQKGFSVGLFEQHYALGGCCSSFMRSGFVFDAGAHSLGSCRPEGQLRQILDELGILDSITIKRAVPSDAVVTEDCVLELGDSLDASCEALATVFPSERANISRFMDEISQYRLESSVKFRSLLEKYADRTFRELLDDFFTEERLKQTLAVFLGNAGLPSTRVSAIRAIILFNEFVLDGGYYVVGGMHRLTEALAERFRRAGGSIFMETPVDEILMDHAKLSGIKTADGRIFNARILISTASIQQTLGGFLRKQIGTGQSAFNGIGERLSGLRSSVSAIVLYLGVKSMGHRPTGARTVWSMFGYQADATYESVWQGRWQDMLRTFLIARPSLFDRTLAPAGNETVNIFALAPYIGPEFWKAKKHEIAQDLLDRAGRVFPELGQSVEVFEIATPVTIERYTGNQAGAMYGLASLVSQTRSRVMPQKTFIPGLYLASHWATVGTGQGGTPMAAYAGKNAAHMAASQLARTRPAAEAI